MDPQRVIVGEEILTREGGEILALFVKEEVPRGLPAVEAMRAIEGAGMLSSACRTRLITAVTAGRAPCWKRCCLTWTRVEIFNSRTLIPTINQRAARFAAEYELAGTVGFRMRINCWKWDGRRCRCRLSKSAAELREVIWQGEPELKQGFGVWTRMATRYAIMVQQFRALNGSSAGASRDGKISWRQSKKGVKFLNRIV